MNGRKWEKKDRGAMKSALMQNDVHKEILYVYVLKTGRNQKASALEHT